eukprot:GHVP01043896.1.p1 GENE.GHVP01043896.1~~GHVP01043896.1.p1  ORF type:complete len:193 (+),score=34.82 GHVP01043896.1:434-1012(+)
MGRRKITIKEIKDTRFRLATFKKRKNGLFKKAYELSVLCGCEIGLVIFTPENNLYEYSSEGIENVISRHERTRKMPNESKTNRSIFSEQKEISIDSTPLKEEKQTPVSVTKASFNNRLHNDIPHHEVEKDIEGDLMLRCMEETVFSSFLDYPDTEPIQVVEREDNILNYFGGETIVTDCIIDQSFLFNLPRK